MKNLKQITLIGLLTFAGISITNAQDKKATKVEGKMKVVVVSDEDGKITESTETFSLKDAEEMKKMLKEKGIDMDFDKEGGFNFNFDSDGKNKEIKVIVDQDGGKTRTVTEHIEIHEFSSDEDHTISVDDINVKVEEIEGEDGKTKVIKVSSTNGDFDTKEIIVSALGEMDGDRKGTMFFIRKKSELKVVDLPTSIQESSVEGFSIEDLNLYPNPNNGAFRMTFNSKNKKDFNLTITDAKGSKVYEKKLKRFKGNFSEDFDLSKEENGIYFFNLVSGEEKLTRKIILQ